MATKPMVPVEDYLRMAFEGPEPEYLDGELRERHLGNRSHSVTQGNLGDVFSALHRQGKIYRCPEIHLRITPTRYRVADFAVFLEQPAEEIPSSPPYLIIEIVSPGDSFSEIRQKCEEYRAWGVRHIWLADPSSRSLFVYDGGLRDVAGFELPEFALVITSEQVFG